MKLDENIGIIKWNRAKTDKLHENRVLTRLVFIFKTYQGTGA